MKTTYKTILVNLLFIALTITGLEAQVVVLGCQSETDAVVGIDRKNWNGGNTVSHSEGYMLNYTLPNNTFGDCKKISEVEIEFTIFSIDQTNMPADCPDINTFYTNLYVGCGDTSPASCPVGNILDEFPSTPISDQTLTYTCPPHEFPFGDILGVDIIPVANTGCSTGQSMVSAGSIIIDYEICVTVTVTDDIFDGPAVNLGPDENICSGQTIELDAGSGYDSYDWDPNGETTQMITVGGGVYSVTVTDDKGCTDEDEIEVMEDPLSVTIMSSDADLMICENTTTVLTAITTATMYEWSTGETTSFILAGPGNYDVTVTDLNGCEVTDMITIGSFPEPTVTATPDNGEVCGTGTIQVEATAGFTTYDWGGGIMGQTVQLGDGNYILTITDANGCMATTTVDITSNVAPEAGDDVPLFEVCNDGSTYDIGGELGPNDNTGTWFDEDAAGINLNNNETNVDFEGVIPGIYDFVYTVIGIGACPDDEATITIQVSDQPNAGFDNDIEICNDGTLVDLESYLGTFDPGGTWIDDDNSNVNLSDPTSVDFDGVDEGTYNFIYSITAVAPCSNDDANIEITLIDFVNAGDNAVVSICEGSVFDLNDALSGDATLGGVFDDVDNSNGLNGSMFNTSGLNGQSFDFTYNVGSGGSCGSDEATITVDVVTSVFAGNDNLSNEICIDGDIDLFDFIPTADPGGVFNDVSNSGELSGSIFDATQAGAGTYIFEYEVGDDITCPADISEIEITLNEIPTISLSEGTQLCSGQCAELTMSFTGDPTFAFTISIYDVAVGANTVNVSSPMASGDVIFWVCNDGGIGSFSNDTIHIGNSSLDWYVIPNMLTDAHCEGEFNAPDIDTSFFQATETITTDLNTTICLSDSVVVNGVTYNFNNPVGAESLISSANCDSIVNIDLNFHELADSLFQPVLCMGDSIEVDGIFFSELNPNATIILDDASSLGCDSIVNISLSFIEMPDTLLQIDLCSGSSIDINGVTYDETNPTGSTLLEDASSIGCDSLVNVEVSFASEIDSMVIMDLCEGENIVINNVNYNQLNPSGTETLTGVNACDTLVTIDLTFDQIYAFDNPQTICSGDSLFVGGAWQFTSGDYIDALSSIEGCDSTVTTQLTVEACQSQINIVSTNNACIGTGLGQIKITIESGSAPFTIDWIGTANGDSGSVVANSINEEACIENLFSDNYDLTIFDSMGAEVGSETVSIIDENPAITGTIDILSEVSCAGESDGSIQGNISGGTGNYTYTWTPDLGNTDILNGIPSGLYTLDIMDSAGCTANFSTSLENPQGITAMIESSNTSCLLATDGTISITNITGGLDPYIVTVNGDILLFPYVYTNANEGSYQIQILDANGCAFTDQIDVISATNPDLLNYVEFYEIELGDSIVLAGEITGNTSNIVWDANPALSCLDCPNPTANPTQSEIYTLTVTNEEGCVDQITVSVLVVEKENEIYFPNAFSPNGDGVNDTFDIFQSEDNDITATFRLFNRWGNLLVNQVQQTGVGNGWNGRVNGSEVQPGVYVYIFSYIDGNNQLKEFTGELTLVD